VTARVEGNLKVNDQIVALGAHLLQEGREVRVATSDAGMTRVSHEVAK
jgi:hypothetical protein